MDRNDKSIIKYYKILEHYHKIISFGNLKDLLTTTFF